MVLAATTNSMSNSSWVCPAGAEKPTARKALAVAYQRKSHSARISPPLTHYLTMSKVKSSKPPAKLKHALERVIWRNPLISIPQRSTSSSEKDLPRMQNSSYNLHAKFACIFCSNYFSYSGSL